MVAGQVFGYPETADKDTIFAPSCFPRKARPYWSFQQVWILFNISGGPFENLYFWATESNFPPIKALWKT